MPDTIHILLADDHAILRAGLHVLLDNQSGLEVVGEAGDGSEALEKARTLQPDLVLLDLNMPGLDGLAALPLLKRDVPNCKILILTMYDDASYLKEALQAGASGYLLKRAVDSELLMAIQAVMRGEVYVHSAMTGKLIAQVIPGDGHDEKTDLWATLSEREFDVLRLVALGYTNAEIAQTLYLSPKTVETYRARGMEKLNLHSRAQLVKAALARGLLED